MAAQIKNTLRSLLPPYQRGVETNHYEIILIDNGSAKILDNETRTISPNLQYIYLPPNESSPNPASAMNRAAALARAPLLCLMIDGARMLTPGVLSWGIRLLELSPGAIVEVRGWHLGPKWQPESVTEGYNHETETQLLEEALVGKRLPGFSIFRQAARRPSWEFHNQLRNQIVFSSVAHCLIDLPGSTNAMRKPAVDWSTWTFMRARSPQQIQVHGGAATSLSLEELRLAIVHWGRLSG
jgi:hypothetical protein